MTSTTRSMSTVKEARELYELKEKAAKFYAENGVPQKMEDILNSMFYDNPKDVYGHLASYFQGFAKSPTITKVRTRTAIDSKAQSTIQTDVYCTVNNKEKLVSSIVYPSAPPVVLEIAKPEEKEEEDKEREENVTAAVKYLNSDINNRLQGLDPTKQEEADSIISELVRDLKKVEDERLAKEAEEKEKTEDSDETEKKTGSALSKEKPKSGGKESPDKLAPLPVISGKEKATSKRAPSRAKSRVSLSRMQADVPGAGDAGGKGGKGAAPVVVVPDEPKEQLLCGSACVGAMSVAVCNAGANVADSELYEYIAALKFGANPREYRLPLPMVTIFQSGRASPGKSSCVKEYMVVPRPGKPLKEAVPQMLAIYNDIIKSIVNKNGVVANKKGERVAARNVSDTGALMMSFDRPEQGLDLIQEAMTHVGLTAGEDFYIALNLAGHEIFDYEKGKYEVIIGQQKVPDDMVDFWAELLGRYPAVIAIIDPLRKQEDRQWMMLSERISDKCYVIGGQAWHRPGLLKDEELTDKFKTSGIMFKLEHMNTVSDIIQCSKKMEEASNEIVLSTNVGDSSDIFLADMAVGMNARFIKLGAPCRGERVAKLNRLLAIEERLEELGKLTHHGEFKFPVITIPMEPTPEDQEPDEEEVKKDAGKKK